MTSRDQDERLFDYLYDELSPEERAAFEREMAADPTLADRARAYGLVRETARALPEAPAPTSLLARIQAEARLAPPPPARVGFWARLAATLQRPAFASAVAVVLLLGASLLFLRRGGEEAFAPRSAEPARPAASAPAPVVERWEATKVEEEKTPVALADEAPAPEEPPAPEEAPAPEKGVETLSTGLLAQPAPPARAGGRRKSRGGGALLGTAAPAAKKTQKTEERPRAERAQESEATGGLALDALAAEGAAPVDRDEEAPRRAEDHARPAATPAPASAAKPASPDRDAATEALAQARAHAAAGRKREALRAYESLLREHSAFGALPSVVFELATIQAELGLVAPALASLARIASDPVFGARARELERRLRESERARAERQAADEEAAEPSAPPVER